MRTKFYFVTCSLGLLIAFFGSSSNSADFTKSKLGERCFNVDILSPLDDLNCNTVKIQIRFKDCKTGEQQEALAPAFARFDCKAKVKKVKYWAENTMYFAVVEKQNGFYRPTETYSMVYGTQDEAVKTVVPPTVVKKENAEPVAMPTPPALSASVPSVSASGDGEAKPQDVGGAAPAAGSTAVDSAKVMEPEKKGTADSILNGIKLSGLVDTYYLYSMALPAPTTTGGLTSPGSLSTAAAGATPRGNVTYLPQIYHDQFTMNLAVISISKETSQYSGVVSLGMGPETSWFGNSGTNLDYATLGVIEAYLVYKIFDGGPSLKFGKFDSLMGYESHYSVLNPNFTFSYGHTWATPTWHSGASIIQKIGNWLEAEAYFVDGWNTLYETNASKSIGARIKVKPTNDLEVTLGGLSGNETAVGGADQKSSGEAIVSYKPISALLLVVDVISSTENISGGALRYVNSNAGYVKYKITDQWAIAGRYESYYDDALFTTGLRSSTPSASAPQVILSTTGTVVFTPSENLIFKFEYRSDQSNSTVPPFTDSTGAAKDTQSLALSSATLKF